MTRRPRAVLVGPRSELGANTFTLAQALRRVEALGYEVVAVVDVADVRTAHRMVADNHADVLVAARPEHLQTQSLALDPRRPQPLPRPAMNGGDVTRLPDGMQQVQRRPAPMTVPPPEAQRTARLPRSEADTASPAPPRTRRPQPLGGAPVEPRSVVPRRRSGAPAEVVSGMADTEPAPPDDDVGTADVIRRVSPPPTLLPAPARRRRASDTHRAMKRARR